MKYRALFVVTLCILLLLTILIAAAAQTAFFVNSEQTLSTSFNYAIALADLDGDADLDAFIGKDDGNIVWINDGAAVFTDSGQILGNSLSFGVALGDLDGDGDIDAFVANRSSFGGAPDRVWLNDGMGAFSVTTATLGNVSSYDVALADLDQDDDLDAFTAACGNALNPPVNVNILWLNNGQGYFTDAGLDFGNFCSSAVALADLNHDDRIDIVVGNAGSPNPPLPSRGVEIWLNTTVVTQTVSFTKTQVIDLTYNHDIALGDLNQDTHIDIFIANGSSGGGVQPNSVWFNDGTGSFSNSGQLLGSYTSESVTLGDVDFDGDLDAVVGNGFQVGQPNQLWLNDGSGIFTNGNQDFGLQFTLDVALGDLDGDLDLDLYVTNDITDEVWINTAEIPPQSVTVSGPSLAEVGNSHSFTATVFPASAVLPITYTWQATDQSSVSRVSNSITDTIDFAWTNTGMKTITVTAKNSAGMVQSTYMVTVTKTYEIFLPIISKPD